MEKRQADEEKEIEEKAFHSFARWKDLLNNGLQEEKTLSESEKKRVNLRKFILENKDYLLKVIEEGNRKKKFRQSAHYVEQKLMYERPHNKQINIFDILSPETKDKIKDESVRYIGIKLSPPEDKLVNSVSRLLEKKSQTKNQEAEDFYMGNEPPRLVPYGGRGVKQKSAVLRCRRSELLKEFFGGSRHSGADIKYFDRIFASFLEKKWLIRYTRTIKKISSKNKQPENKRYIIEDYLPLIKVLKYFPDLSEEESRKIEEGNKEFRASSGEYILSLNPILTDQISSKFIEFPEDIDLRTKIASASHFSVSEAVIRLRDWLISETSLKRFRSEINYDTLLYRLCLDKHSRKPGRRDQQLEKAIQVNRNLGIILDLEMVLGSFGQKKFIFDLDRNFS